MNNEHFQRLLRELKSRLGLIVRDVNVNLIIGTTCANEFESIFGENVRIFRIDERDTSQDSRVGYAKIFRDHAPGSEAALNLLQTSRVFLSL